MAISFAPDVVRISLEAKRQELLARCATSREDIHVVRHRDEIDELTHAVEREVATAELEHRSQLVRQITDALGRLAAGSYGRCLSCGGQIAAARLRSVPWTPHCLRCQEAAEREQGAGRASSRVRIG